MSNNENNLGMGGETGVNESPMPDDTGASPSAFGSDTQLVDEISAEEFADLKAKAGKADENWEKYVRSVADLDNYKKRAIRERQDAIKYANESLVEKLLPIVDNFEAALSAANAPQGGNVDSLKMGVNMIYTQLKSFLSESGA